MSTEDESATQGPRPDGHPLLARTMDLWMWPLVRFRRAVVPRARGRVLEVGIGTGANLRWYARDGSVAEVVGVEPDAHMRRRTEHVAATAPFPVTLVDADAARLPFDDASFDTVVATFVLCTIPDAEGAAHEMARVLRPDGVLLYAEHVASEGALGAGLQGLARPCWCHLFGGCRLDREGHRLLDAAGLVRTPGHTPPWAHNPFPIQWGEARRGVGA
jgi:SAM-dependent methyltransferase